MASGFLPSPPSEDFLESLFSSQTLPTAPAKSSRQWRGVWPHYQQQRSAREPPRHNKDILGQSIPFGGEGFYDHISLENSESAAIGSGSVADTDSTLTVGTGGALFPSSSLQAVPVTPAFKGHVQIPQSEDHRLQFHYNDSNVENVIGLRPVSEIPRRYRSVFSSFSHFNLIQSKVFDDVMYTDHHLVTSAPTGSGKTVIFELAIIRVLMQASNTFNSLKIVYVAPIKALCSERCEEWTTKFGPFGLRCSELTGDSQLDDYFELQNAQIIMTTPEKWDSMTRKWRDNKSLVQLVQLFLLDEVHQLNDESRGPTVEAIVSRMKTVRTSVARERQSNHLTDRLLRFIAVSATIPNIDDIAAWLGSEDQPAIKHCIDDSHRPVQLRRVVLGFPNATTEFKFDLSLNYKICGVIQCYSDQKPTLVFCATRKGTQQAAGILVKDARFVMNTEHRRRLQSIAGSVNDSKLRELVLYGVGYHHAGMSTNDRKLIETTFTNGELPVLFATSTLAMGVNLPAHLVIIKSTLHYVGGMFQEYTESQILQMIGRAGRPQFDTTATAVILTRNSTKEKYEALLSGSQLIESNLHSHLIEHLNAEIVLCTITDVSIALEWLKSTFLYVRIKKNPKHYNIPENLPVETLEEKLQDMCLKDLHLLEASGLVNMDDGFSLVPTETGRLMARYYVAFESMERFLKLRGTETLGELVEELSKCEEFKEVRLRMNEKRLLNQLNKDKYRATIRFPMAGKIKSTDMKVNCLIQSSLGCLPIQEFGLNQDTQKILRSASRLCRCLLELVLLRANYTGLLTGALLYKCVQARLWEDSKYVVKQLDKIGQALSTTLVNAGLTTFSKLLETNPRELELIVNRHPPFGNQVKEAVSRLPQYSLTVQQVQSVPLTKHQAELTVTVTLLNHLVLKETGSTAGPSHTCLLIVGDEDNKVVLKEKIVDSQLLSSGKWSKRVTVRQCSKGPNLNVHFISLEFVGFDVQQEFTPRYLKLQPLTISQPKQELQSKGPTAVTSSANRNKGRQKLCSHRCINKAVCGHDCCKYGLDTASGTPADELEQQPLPSSTSTYHTPVKVGSNRSKATHASRTGKEMATHISDLHHRVQSIPPTPGLKRSRVMESDYRDYLNPLSDRFSYTPKPKLPAASSSVGAVLIDSDDEYDEFASLDCDLLLNDLECSLYDDDLSDLDDQSPPPLPPPIQTPSITQLQQTGASLQRKHTFPPTSKKPAASLPNLTQNRPSFIGNTLQQQESTRLPLSISKPAAAKLVFSSDQNKAFTDSPLAKKPCRRNIFTDLTNAQSTGSSSLEDCSFRPSVKSSNLSFFTSGANASAADDDDFFAAAFDGIF